VSIHRFPPWHRWHRIAATAHEALPVRIVREGVADSGAKNPDASDSATC
jgi:hypothetical protein